MIEPFDWVGYQLALDVDLELLANRIDLVGSHCLDFRMFDIEILHERLILDFVMIDSFKCGNSVFLLKLPQFVQIYLSV